MPRSSKRTGVKVGVGLVAFLAAMGLLVFLVLIANPPELRAQRHFERAEKLAVEHDYPKAVVELRNALGLKSNMLPAWRKLAQIQEATQQWGGLTDSLQSIVGLAPDDIDARVKLAKLLALGGRVYQALELTKVSDESEPSAKLIGVRAAILYRLNDKSEAVRQASTALALDANNADALVVLANAKMAADDIRGALTILESVGGANSSDVGVQLTKLKIYEQLGEQAKIEALLKGLIEHRPQEVSFRKKLVEFYINQHRTGDAEKESRAIVAEFPADPEAELYLVRLLFTLKGAEAARAELLGRINAGGDVFPYQIALANFDYQSGNTAGAEERLQKLINGAGNPQQILAAQAQLAEIYLKTSRSDAAESLASKILQKNSREVTGLKLRASVQILRGQVEPAIVDLQQVLADQPRATEVMVLLAFAYEQSGAIGRAEKLYSDAVRVSNFDPVVGLDYAQFLLRRGNVDRAEKFLTELCNRTPNNLAVLEALAKVELARQDWTSAENVADRMRKAGDARGVAEQIRGAALLGQKKYDESIAELQSAVNASPAALPPLSSLVAALVRAKKGDQAVGLIESAVQASPENSELEVLRGSLRLVSGDSDEALKAFRAAITKDRTNVGAYLAISKLYISQKKFDEAVKTIRSGLQVAPDNITLHLSLAAALEMSQQYEAAIVEYEQILSRQPNSMVAANNLASLLSDQRSDKTSFERAKGLTARLKDSPVPQFKDTLGWISYRSGDYVGAVSLLEKAAIALPDVALVHYHLAMSYIAVNEPSKASEKLNAALLLAPNPELEGKIREALKNLGA